MKPGGRTGLVLPDGTLFGEGVKTCIKESLLTECNLHTIVRLPNGVFNPYTGIRSNLLFFTKGTPTRDVWYYEHPYPPGAKSYNKTKPIRIEEFDAEKKWWGKPEKHGHYSKRKENEFAWRVSIDTIKAGNFNLDLKNPHRTDDIGHRIVEFGQQGADRAAYGERLLPALAERLAAAGPKRVDARDLRRFRLFYTVYPQIRESLSPELLAHRGVAALQPFLHLSSLAKRETLSPESPIVESLSPQLLPVQPDLLHRLSFSHLAELLELSDETQRRFYEIESIKDGWLLTGENHRKASTLYQRFALSRDKADKGRTIMKLRRSEMFIATQPSNNQSSAGAA